MTTRGHWVPRELPVAVVLERIEQIASTIPEAERQVIRGLDRAAYLTRYRLGELADGGHIYLHHIHRADEDAELHSHPWGACALVLLGGYTEWRRVGVAGAFEVVERVLRRGDLNVLELDTFHRVASVEPNTWTLVVTTPKAQSWEFWNVTTGATTHQKVFLAQKFGRAPRLRAEVEVRPNGADLGSVDDVRERERLAEVAYAEACVAVLEAERALQQRIQERRAAAEALTRAAVARAKAEQPKEPDNGP